MQVALKFIAKENLSSSSQINRLKREVRVMRLLDHPNIVKLRDVIETEKSIILAMEYVPGGELYDFLLGQKRVKETQARRFFRQLLSAVFYLHQNFIIHRDLKPENVLLDSRHNVKVVDFGFTTLFNPNKLRETFCGSPYYAAPEMVTSTQYIGPEVDIWSLGVILFTILAGTQPFEDKTIETVTSRIAQGLFTIPEFFSKDSRDLTKRMLTVDIRKRATLMEVFNHPWVVEGFGQPPETHLPVRPQKVAESEIQTELLDKVALFGMDPECVRQQVTNGELGPGWALYWLIKEKSEKNVDNRSNMKRTSLPYDSSNRSSRKNSVSVAGGTVSSKAMMGGSSSRASTSVGVEGFDDDAMHTNLKLEQNTSNKSVSEKTPETSDLQLPSPTSSLTSTTMFTSSTTTKTNRQFIPQSNYLPTLLENQRDNKKKAIKLSSPQQPSHNSEKFLRRARSPSVDNNANDEELRQAASRLLLEDQIQQMNNYFSEHSPTNTTSSLSTPHRMNSMKSSIHASASSGFSISKSSGYQLPSSASSTIARTIGERSRASLNPSLKHDFGMEYINSNNSSASNVLQSQQQQRPHERRRSFPQVMLRALQLMGGKKSSRRPSEKPVLEIDEMNSPPFVQKKVKRRQSVSGPPLRKLSTSVSLRKQNKSKSPDSLNTSMENATNANNSLVVPVSRTRRKSSGIEFLSKSAATHMSVETTSIKPLNYIMAEVEKALKLQHGLNYQLQQAWKKSDDGIMSPVGPIAGVLQFFEGRSRRNSVNAQQRDSVSSIATSTVGKSRHDPEAVWTCWSEETDFEVKLIKIPGTKMRGFVFHRLRGTSVDYQRRCNELMSKWQI
ncbi:hypothetical protein HK098_002047 [Nowakowskiella sp. JEL0407]|nr:hypothetical protein HK098_002047 [Nowakowskiella sp. JEL0407]